MARESGLLCTTCFSVHGGQPPTLRNRSKSDASRGEECPSLVWAAEQEKEQELPQHLVKVSQVGKVLTQHSGLGWKGVQWRRNLVTWLSPGLAVACVGCIAAIPGLPSPSPVLGELSPVPTVSLSLVASDVAE